MFKGFIIEGTSYSGKTSTMQSISKLLPTLPTSPKAIIVIPEEYSQVLYRKNGQDVALTRKEHLELLNQQVAELERLWNWGNSIGQNRLFFMFERFHLNHRYHWYTEEDILPLLALESRLKKMQAACILLTISPEKIPERIRERSPHKWASRPAEMLAKKATVIEQAQHQYRYQGLKSKIPTFEINTDGKEWDKYARQILAYYS